MKKLSIGSKRENAKQIDINLERKHLVFAGMFFAFALLFHMFVYSPYLEYEQKIVCLNESEVLIIDNMTKVCDIDIPYNMTTENIVNYITEQQTDLIEVNING